MALGFITVTQSAQMLLVPLGIWQARKTVSEQQFHSFVVQQALCLWSCLPAALREACKIGMAVLYHREN